MVEFLRTIFSEKRLGYSIVALLDDEHERLIQDLWQELEQEYGIKHPFLNPVPHITHIQAQKSKGHLLREALEKFSTMQAPYLVRTAGLGIFTGERLALYVPVVRNPALTAIQTTLLSTVAGALEGVADTHQVNNWLPHITLIIPIANLDENLLARVVQGLARRSFVWEIKIKRLAILDGLTKEDDAPFTVELKET